MAEDGNIVRRICASTPGGVGIEIDAPRSIRPRIRIGGVGEAAWRPIRVGDLWWPSIIRIVAPSICHIDRRDRLATLKPAADRVQTSALTCGTIRGGDDGVCRIWWRR